MGVIALLVLTGSATADKADTSAVIIKRGLNLNKYNQMLGEVRSNPSYANVEFRAEAESEDVVYHSTAKIGPFSIAGKEYGQTREHILHLGVPVELQAEVESPVDRIEPVELALAGMAYCITGTIAVHAVVNISKLTESEQPFGRRTACWYWSVSKTLTSAMRYTAKSAWMSSLRVPF
ncbi:MAG: hypothetical protein GF310_10040 [candidate division Zixibacteria bacterium]|nr:hypothetical protein [candidate division Zixibacteria bacterium]